MRMLPLLIFSFLLTIATATDRNRSDTFQGRAGERPALFDRMRGAMPGETRLPREGQASPSGIGLRRELEEYGGRPDGYARNEFLDERFGRPDRNQPHFPAGMEGTGLSSPSDGARLASAVTTYLGTAASFKQIVYTYERWDGVQWVLDWRYTINFNTAGYFTEEIDQSWDGAQWVNEWRYANTYDAAGNSTEYISQVWDGIQWVNVWRYTSAYDGAGNLTEFIWQWWELTQWVNDWRDTYIYDASGTRTEYLFQYWDGAQWVDSGRGTYAYDGEGNLTEEIGQWWDGTQWVIRSRYVATYDAAGNLTERIYQSWDGTQWVNMWRYAYTYDAAGNRTEYLNQDWNGLQWVNDWRYTYTYDASGNRTEYLSQDWDGFQWVNDWHETYTYDAAGYMAGGLGQAWSGSQWVDSYRFTVEYEFNELTAAFTAEPASGVFPLAVQFNDQSVGTDSTTVTSWRWDFQNNGSIDNGAQNPTYTYNQPGYYSVSLVVGDGVSSDTLVRENYIYVTYPDHPVIAAVKDVPNDQGGSAVVHFSRSRFDLSGLAKGITAAQFYSVELLQGTQWVALNTTGAYGKTNYAVQVSTPADSSAAVNYLLTFRAVAFMDSGNFAGPNFQGYSVDNLAPAQPENLSASVNSLQDVELNWDGVLDIDFSHFRIYRGRERGFDLVDGVAIGEPRGTTYVDSLAPKGSVYTYRVTAVDIHGNASLPSSTTEEVILPAMVYPGDTDNSGVVDALDLLPIGVHFYAVGPARAAGSYSWTSQQIYGWEELAAQYADANGDGIVDERDVIGIGVNWASNHALGKLALTIDPDDAVLLEPHLPAFRTLYRSLSGEGEAAREMRTLLRRVLGIAIPEAFVLGQNYPNPFNPTSNISFELPQDQRVTVTIYNVLGQEITVLVDNQFFMAGNHSFQVDAADFSSGVYFYHLQAGQWHGTRKMMVLK